jgi:hypothetical protein
MAGRQREAAHRISAIRDTAGERTVLPCKRPVGGPCHPEHDAGPLPARPRSESLMGIVASGDNPRETKGHSGFVPRGTQPGVATPRGRHALIPATLSAWPAHPKGGSHLCPEASGTEPRASRSLGRRSFSRHAPVETRRLGRSKPPEPCPSPLAGPASSRRALLAARHGRVRTGDWAGHVSHCMHTIMRLWRLVRPMRHIFLKHK